MRPRAKAALACFLALVCFGWAALYAPPWIAISGAALIPIVLILLGLSEYLELPPKEE